MQDMFEEGSGALVAGKPVVMQDEIVDLVREDELVDGDAASAEGVGETRSLLVGDVGIVIAVNEEDGRFPAVDGSHGRACMGDGGDALLLGERAAQPVRCSVVLARPLVHAVVVDAGSEEIAVARESQRSEVAAITTATDANARLVDI